MAPTMNSTPKDAERRLLSHRVVLPSVCGLLLLSLSCAPRAVAQAAPAGGARPPGFVAVAAVSALEKIPDYRQALRALRDRQPRVAAVKLERLRASGGVTGPAAVELLLRLAEAQARAERPEEVLAVTDEPAVRGEPEARFWRALALARLERWSEAAKELDHVAAVRDFRFAEEAAFSRAGVLAALGDYGRALRVLAELLEAGDAEVATRARLWSADLLLTANRPAEAEGMLAPLLDKTDAFEPEVRFLQARLKLHAGDAAGAEPLFHALEGRRGRIPPRLREAAALGRVRALRRLNRPREAMAAARQLIDQTPSPGDDILGAAFAEFEEINGPGDAEAAAALEKWETSMDLRVKIRARLARAAAAGAAGRAREAENLLASVEKDFPDHPLTAEALARRAAALVAGKRREEALAVVEGLKKLSPGPALRAWGEWLAGRAEYEAENFTGAELEFAAAAERAPTPEAREKAAYNAAIAELRGGVENATDSLMLLDEKTRPEDRNPAAEFHLERALYLAARGAAKEAEEGLMAFVEALPEHPRAFDAWFALAELALTAEPPEVAALTAALREAVKKADTPERRERTELLKVYAAEAAEADPAAAARALAREEQEFSERFPESPHRTELRMRVARALYTRGDYAGARQKFLQLAEEEPRHPLAEAALFWAGRATLLALGPNREAQAMELWERVFQRGGPLKWEARLQVALLNRSAGRSSEALRLLDEMLAASPPPDAATRRQALCLRGEILAAPSMTPRQQEEGLASFDRVAREPDAPAFWRHQALVRKGGCLELLKRVDEALEAYYDVLNDPPAETGGESDLWFHRAGEKGQRLLEARGKYKEAVELVKKRAKAPGPRGRQAADLVNRLSLQYFIWTGDDPAPR